MSEPLHFGPPERRLFGIFHAAPLIEGRAAVVLCNAFGQEAIRSHRAWRVLAERLSRAGQPTLRFDYYGTGDSAGDDEDGDLDMWADDLRAADDRLRELSGAQGTVWVGMRLGGTIALHAARLAPAGVERLVLWDPVLDGPGYLAHLRQRHVASFEGAYSLKPKPAPAVQALDPTRFVDEAIGFALGPRLRQQLQAINPAQQHWPASPASIAVVSDPDDPQGSHLDSVCSREPGRAEVVIERHGCDWTADTANNTALVPARALSHLLRLAGAAA